MISQDAFYDRKYSKQKTEKRYCDDCEKETEHEVSEGHNGWDRWFHSECLECLEIEEEN